MIDFKVENLDPTFIFNSTKIIGIMNEIGDLLTFADGPNFNGKTAGKLEVFQNNYTYKLDLNKERGTLICELWQGSMYLLKVKNDGANTLNFKLNLSNYDLEVKEIFRLFVPYQISRKSTSKPSDC